MKSMYKRLLVLLITAVMLVTVFATGAFAAETEEREHQCYLHGDVDGDGGITPNDAIYALYHNFNEERYPIDQSCDFDGDEMVTPDDAIYLLRANFKDDLLQGEIHDWFDPAWTWAQDGEGYSATVTLKCACGEPIVYIDEVVVTEDEDAYREPTCVTPGQKVYVATVTDDEGNVVVTDTYTVELPTGGHALQGGQGCEDPIYCENCDYEQAARGHEMEPVGEPTTGSCQVESVQTYKCENCDHTEEVKLGVGPCTYELDEPRLQDGRATCYWLKRYKCTGCGNVIDGTAEDDFYTIHTYTAELTKEANCCQTGLKVYTCSDCGDSYEEVVGTIADAHIWDSGVTADGITTYTCTAGCGATKTAVVASENMDTAALAGNELELAGGATMKLDDAAAEALDAEKKVTVSIAEANVEGLLNQAQLEQIGDSPVYDFSMTYDNGDAVTDFAGNVTISLPYELQEGDDIDCIDIWFIADDGTLTNIEGIYANGYVTFTTNHFSYYTVTRLSPKERCELYGHLWVDSNKLPTCTEEGYSMRYCQRCGEQDENNKTPMLGHSYAVVEEKSTPATCLEKGVKVEKCATCGHERTSEVPALGHKLKVEKTEPECEKAGSEIVTCENGCGFHTEKTLPALSHIFEAGETVDPDCTTHGHTKQTCKLCGKTEEKDKTLPTGHDYNPENAVWTWNANHTSAEVKLVCSHNANHTKTLKAVVTENAEAAGCTSSGSVVYTATASFNNVTYTDSYSEEVGAVGHTPAEGWDSNKYYHYKECEVCGESFDEAEHRFGDTEVIKAPTCNQVGSGVEVCEVCGYESTVVIPATGEHTFVNGVCSVCGFDENACTHVVLRTKVPIDLSGYDFCGEAELFYLTCDCGEAKVLGGVINCQSADEITEQRELVTLPDGTQKEMWVHTATCRDCGLTLKQGFFTYTDEEECVGYEAEYFAALVDGKIIGAGVNINREYEYAHPNKTVREIDMSQYGLCGGTVFVHECYCGDSTYVDFWGDGEGCQWVWQQTDAGNKWVCSECGAVRTLVSNGEEEGCCLYTTDLCSWYNAQGELLLELEGNSVETYHDYNCVDFTLYGESCEDGVLCQLRCTVCGKTREIYVERHYTGIREVTDLSGSAFCADRIEHYTCPCGEAQHDYEVLMTQGHNFVTDTDGTVFCDNCGYTRVVDETYGPKEPGSCWQQVSRITTYTGPDGDVITIENTYNELNHDYEEEYILAGNSCTDGVTVRSTCSHCGETEEWTTDNHVGKPNGEVFDLSELGSCFNGVETHNCVCGLEAGLSWHSSEYNSWCNFSGVWDENGNYVYDQCTNCGLCLYTEVTEREMVDDCHERVSYVHTFERNGKTLTFSCELVESRHAFKTDFTLDVPGGSCHDGANIHQVCEICGFEHTYHITWHESFLVDEKVYTEDALCGPVTVGTRRCACGMDNWSYAEFACDFNMGHWNEDLGMHMDVCGNCGSQHASNRRFTKADSEDPCLYDEVEVVSFYSAKNEKLFSYERSSSNYLHTTKLTFELLGNTCQDGYRINGQCTTCGEAVNYGEEIRYDETFWMMERQLLFAGGDDTCGAVFFNRVGCACGKESGHGTESSCRFRTVGHDSNTGEMIERCTECGLEMYTNTEFNKIPGECTADTVRTYRFVLNGQELKVSTVEYQSSAHDTVTTFQLVGSDCDEGYVTQEVCRDCGLVVHTSEVRYGHDVHYVDRIDYTEYGKCWGSVEIHSCACGKEGSTYVNVGCGNHVDHDSATNMSKYYCPDCGITTYYSSNGDFDRANCLFTGMEHVILEAADGTVLLDKQYDVSRTQHTHITQFIPVAADGSLTEGYHITGHCVYCGDSFYDQNIYFEDPENHSGHLVDFVDLGMLGSACGGYLEVHGCPCGESTSADIYGAQHNYSHTYREETDAEGIVHHISERTCVDCGLVNIHEYYDVETEEACRYKQVSRSIYRLNGWEKIVEGGHYYYAHEDVTTRTELMEGASSCDEGVWIYNTCRNCGREEVYESHGGYHNAANITESIDLAEYGSICGAQLNEYSCACGKEVHWDVVGECDMGQQWIENFIPGSIEDTWQDTTEGYIYTDSDSWILACAVTDPEACGLVIRMSEYWLKEGCSAVEYQTWQLGYDRENDTFQREITVATGERHAFHDYTAGYVHQQITNDDGSITDREILECPDCDSYYYYENIYLNGDPIGYGEKAYNDPDLNNGERREKTYTNRYDAFHNGYYYESLYRWEYVNADGSVYWDQTEYTDYDFTNGCKRTAYWTDSNGNSEIRYNEDAHRNITGWEWIKEPTCSQPGVERWYNECAGCGMLVEEEYYDRDPADHIFGEYDYDTGRYVCDRCGLESQNGVSGAIVMEDLCDAYGNGEDMVIGYWDRTDASFVPTVSLVLYNGDFDVNYLVVTDVTIEDFRYWNIENNGINALAINRQLVMDAADAVIAEAGYEGDYAIRISFVPADDTTLDYAITFDTLSTVQ